MLPQFSGSSSLKRIQPSRKKSWGREPKAAIRIRSSTAKVARKISSIQPPDSGL